MEENTEDYVPPPRRGEGGAGGTNTNYLHPKESPFSDVSANAAAAMVNLSPKVRKTPAQLDAGKSYLRTVAEKKAAAGVTFSDVVMNRRGSREALLDGEEKENREAVANDDDGEFVVASNGERPVSSPERREGEGSEEEEEEEDLLTKEAVSPEKLVWKLPPQEDTKKKKKKSKKKK